MENYKKYLFILLLIILAVIGGIYVHWRLTATPCSSAPSELCATDGFEEKFHPFLISFFSLLPTILLFFFVRHETFVAWAKFAAVGFPVMLALLLYAFNIEQSTGSWIGGPTEAQIASVVLPTLFFLISLGIIIFKWLQGRKTMQ